MKDNEHLTVEKISESLHEFQQDYSQRLTLLNKAYEKIYAIFLENGINPRFLNEMTCKIISDFHLIYEISQSNFIFSIIIRLNVIKGSAPDCWANFRVKNTISKLIFEEKFNVFTLETTLSRKFILFFSNIFSNFCKNIAKTGPKITLTVNGTSVPENISAPEPIDPQV